MALRTKCILKEKSPDDGIRISVMSRHTLNDGVTPDERITKDLFQYHLVELAPSPKLLGDYYKRGLSWDAFAERFKEELITVPKLKQLTNIFESALFENITLLCIEETAEKCHRRLVAEFCQELCPELVIEHH